MKYILEHKFSKTSWLTNDFIKQVKIYLFMLLSYEIQYDIKMLVFDK